MPLFWKVGVLVIFRQDSGGLESEWRSYGQFGYFGILECRCSDQVSTQDLLKLCSNPI